MSAYAEYKYAKTDAEREEALKGIRDECRRDDFYWNDMYEHDYEDYDDCEEDDLK